MYSGPERTDLVCSGSRSSTSYPSIEDGHSLGCGGGTMYQYSPFLGGGVLSGHLVLMESRLSVILKEFN